MRKIILGILLLSSIHGVSQFLNRDVKAIIEVVKSEKVFEITSKAENISNINQSLLYELKVFKKNKQSENVSKNTQSGRFVISPKEVKKISFRAIDSDEENDQVIVLLLIRNLENEIIGKDRILITDNVIIDNEIIGKDRKLIVDNIIINSEENSITLKRKPKDGIRLPGVVLERVKTKPGRDFYGFFYSQFLSYNFTDSRTVMVEEVFSRGRTTKIHIKVDNIKIYEFFVQPKTDYLKNNAVVAVKIIYSFFSKKEKDYIVKY